MAKELANGSGELLIDIEFCIPKVPRHLRKVNEEAYTPQLISIGPYHYGKIELADMEKHKIRYMKAFYERITRDGQKQLENFIIKNEEKIRRQYAEPPEFPSDKFVKIILFDAVFIIELFLIVWYRGSRDFLLNEVWVGAIRRDLQLLENQLPYFVLEDLYNLAFSSTTKHVVSDSLIPFRTLSCLFFQLHISHNRQLQKDLSVKIQHFTDLCRYALVKMTEGPKFRGITYGLPNAVKLKKSGVKFKRSSADKYLVEIELEKKIRLLSFYNVVELKIPRIAITDNMECLIRNLMILEQCNYPFETYICSYIDLMDSLINTEEDVDLLIEKKIIYNPSGDNAVIADMFNKLRLQIPPSQSSYYHSIYQNLTDHVRTLDSNGDNGGMPSKKATHKTCIPCLPKKVRQHAKHAFPCLQISSGVCLIV